MGDYRNERRVLFRSKQQLKGLKNIGPIYIDKIFRTCSKVVAIKGISHSPYHIFDVENVAFPIRNQFEKYQILSRAEGGYNRSVAESLATLDSIALELAERR